MPILDFVVCALYPIVEDCKTIEFDFMLADKQMQDIDYDLQDHVLVLGKFWTIENHVYTT
jgi:hypothetical protein